MQTIKEISEHVEEIKDKVAQMLDERKKANRVEDMEKQALALQSESDALPAR